MIAMLVMAASGLVGEPPAPPADFVAYVEEIRRAGATEDAQSSLDMVASMIVGDDIIEFPTDPTTGQYGRSYHSTMCSARGLSKEAIQKLMAEIGARREPVLKRLREFADTDHSGFVSTREGSEVRLIFEFGAQLAAIVSKEGLDKTRLCELLHVTPAEFDRRLKAYNSLVQWFAGTTVRYLPQAPTIGAPCDAPNSGLQ